MSKNSQQAEVAHITSLNSEIGNDKKGAVIDLDQWGR